MSTPEAFYREVIDLNRYSNSVAGQYARAYNDIIARAAERLVDIEFRQQGTINAVAPETRKRLRSLIKQSKDSLATWSGESARAFKKELQDLAVLQTEFIEGELKKAVASGNVPINSVAVSKGFGDAVVSTDPTRLNLFGRPEEEFKKFKAGEFALTTRRGELLTLPNGETVEKAFRGIAARSSERLGGAIRQGVLSGETNVQIARRLMGRLNFNEYAKKGTRAFALAGNQPLKLANNQIKTIVRTSINQVSNAASQSVYAANKDVASKYEYVATLDSRTSSTCQRLDGQKFEYDKGPTPPQHFNCRSTTVPVIDYKNLGLTPPEETKITTRPSETGRVPQKESYGDWLYKQRAKGTNNKLKAYEPSELQIKTLGFEKAKYFNRLAAKSNGKDALRQVIRSDGTELTLADLKKKYGKPSSIRSVQDVVPDVATFEKLPKGEQSTIKFLDNLKLNSEAEQKYFKSAKAFNFKLIPKDQFETITPKQLARRIEDDKIAKLQKKLDNKAKKALQPKKEIKRDNRKWNDPSFLDKNLAGESRTSAVRKTSGLGKKKSEDLMFKPKPEEVGLTKAKFKQTEETIGQWSGSDYMQLRGVQLDQAQAVGAQLNPAQIKHLKRYREIRARNEGVRNAWARYADQMENYISKAPKWKGKPQGLMAGQKEPDGTIFRGIGFQDKRIVESIVESYKRGDASLTMESWTANRRIASGFSADKHSVMIKQVNKHGTSIEPWNGLQEKEILQPRGVRYKVLSAETKEWIEDGVERSFTEITLEAY
jgi:SPP1 gp7 family putative phage head morphogenesis protein